MACNAVQVVNQRSGEKFRFNLQDKKEDGIDILLWELPTRLHNTEGHNTHFYM
jgi:hypothetical protein